MDIYEESRCFEEYREEHEWCHQWDNDDIWSLPVSSSESSSENNREKWKHTWREYCEDTCEEWYEDDGDHIYFIREESIGRSFLTRAFS